MMEEGCPPSESPRSPTSSALPTSERARSSLSVASPSQSAVRARAAYGIGATWWRGRRVWRREVALALTGEDSTRPELPYVAQSAPMRRLVLALTIVLAAACDQTGDPESAGPTNKVRTTVGSSGTTSSPPPSPLIVPDVTAKNLPKARRTLRRAGLKVLVVKEDSFTQRNHDIVYQTPAGGMPSRPDRLVTLVLAINMCTPGYSPCIPQGVPPDCRYLRQVRVTGADPYGLDDDHDGIGCE